MHLKTLIAACAGATLVLATGSVNAASDYLLELDGIKGESKSSATGATAPRPVGANAGNTARGPRVAVGDVNGDGKPAPSQPSQNGVLAPRQKPQSALLLPAVQKVREAASK